MALSPLCNFSKLISNNVQIFSLWRKKVWFCLGCVSSVLVLMGVRGSLHSQK
uniref:Uncharacterized protein n=1 Tax=Anguilla anguilla TaxID=7936 RepID=A0A0E9RCK7_ANGAN